MHEIAPDVLGIGPVDQGSDRRVVGDELDVGLRALEGAFEPLHRRPEDDAKGLVDVLLSQPGRHREVETTVDEDQTGHEVGIVRGEQDRHGRSHRVPEDQGRCGK